MCTISSIVGRWYPACDLLDGEGTYADLNAFGVKLIEVVSSGDAYLF